jgi:hypothetical protein
MPKIVADPTPAGTRILRQMVQGAVLVREWHGSIVLRDPARPAACERVHPVTVQRMVERGYLERKGGGFYEITDAGKAALEENG